jgi:hypothetical protein
MHLYPGSQRQDVAGVVSNIGTDIKDDHIIFEIVPQETVLAIPFWITEIIARSPIEKYPEFSQCLQQHPIITSDPGRTGPLNHSRFAP